MEAERRQVTVLFADMVGLHELLGTRGGGSGLQVHAKPVEADDEAVREQSISLRNR